jgi:hypothetical protein
MLKMESFQAYKLNAEQKVKIADHLLSTTYNLVKEPKLLISVVENLFLALDLIITGLLEYEKSLKAITSYSENFDSRMDIFRRKIMTKYGVGKDFMDFVLELKAYVDQHKRSSTEFSKKGKFVISDNDFNIKTLSVEDVRKRVTKTRHYIEELYKITKK